MGFGMSQSHKMQPTKAALTNEDIRSDGRDIDVELADDVIELQTLNYINPTVHIDHDLTQQDGWPLFITDAVQSSLIMSPQMSSPIPPTEGFQVHTFPHPSPRDLSGSSEQDSTYGADLSSFYLGSLTYFNGNPLSNSESTQDKIEDDLTSKTNCDENMNVINTVNSNDDVISIESSPPCSREISPSCKPVQCLSFGMPSSKLDKCYHECCKNTDDSSHRKEYRLICLPCLTNVSSDTVIPPPPIWTSLALRDYVSRSHDVLAPSPHLPFIRNGFVIDSNNIFQPIRGPSREGSSRCRSGSSESSVYIDSRRTSDVSCGASWLDVCDDYRYHDNSDDDELAEALCSVCQFSYTPALEDLDDFLSTLPSVHDRRESSANSEEELLQIYCDPTTIEGNNSERPGNPIADIFKHGGSEHFVSIECTIPEALGEQML